MSHVKESQRFKKPYNFHFSYSISDEFRPFALPYPTVRLRTPPYPPFFTLFGLKTVGTMRYGTVTVEVRYGDGEGTVR